MVHSQLLPALCLGAKTKSHQSGGCGLGPLE